MMFVLNEKRHVKLISVQVQVPCYTLFTPTSAGKIQMKIPYQDKYLIAVLALLVIPLSGLCVDIYIPSLPAIAEYFAVNKSFVQYTITTYLGALESCNYLLAPFQTALAAKNLFYLDDHFYISRHLRSLVP